MKSSSEMIGEAQNKFIESRRGKCKDYTRKILNFLLFRREKDLKTLKKRREQEPDLDPDLALIGWVRAKEIKDRKICYEPTLFRLLTDLSQDKGNIIQREEKNSNEVYYRIPPDSPNVEFYTYEEMYEIHTKEIATLTGKNIDLTFDLFDAKYVLKHNKYANLLPEYEQRREITKNIGEGYEKWKERKLRERN